MLEYADHLQVLYIKLKHFFVGLFLDANSNMVDKFSNLQIQSPAILIIVSLSWSFQLNVSASITWYRLHMTLSQAVAVVALIAPWHPLASVNSHSRRLEGKNKEYILQLFGILLMLSQILVSQN